MPITLQNIRTDTMIILVWRGNGILRNISGNAVAHTTSVISGTIEIRFKDRTITLTAGQDIVLPTGTMYDVVTIGPAIVHCLYPHGPAADSIRHLLSETPKVFRDTPIERCIQRVPDR